MNPTPKRTELTEAVLSLKPRLWRALAFSIIGAVLVLMPTWYMLEVYERVVNSRSHMTLAMLTLLVVWVYVVMEVLDWVRSQTLFGAAQAFDREIAMRVFHVIYQSNLRRLNGGSTQPMNDFRIVRDFIHHPVVAGVMEAPVSLLFMVILFAIHPIMGWAALGVGVVQVIVGFFNARTTNPLLTEANRAAVLAQRQAESSLRNAEVIEAMGILPSLHERWLKLQRTFLGKQAQASDAAGAFQAIGKFLQTTQGSLLLGLGAWLMLHGLLPGAGGLMIVGSVLGARMLVPIVQTVAQWRAVVDVREAWARLDMLLEQFPPVPVAMPLPPPKGAVSVEQLVVAPPPPPGAPGGALPPPILRGLEFRLQPGEVLAVIGPSAAGKTTLARVLVGLWPAMNGKVRLDGVDMFSWDKLELGPHIGYLPQGVELLDGTIAENISRFGRLDMPKIEAAARAVGLHDHIMSLPKAYDSPVGREGAMLSGGQRQRIALARAVYGDPVFIVLDEPNSSLDQEGDAALAQTISTMKSRGTTFVVMTHRTSVLDLADHILVLREGTQQAFGPRSDVLAALRKGASPVPAARAPSAGGLASAGSAPALSRPPAATA